MAKVWVGRLGSAVSRAQATASAALNLNLDSLADETNRRHLDQHDGPGFGARVGLTLRLGAQEGAADRIRN